MTHFNIGEEALDLKGQGAKLLWGSIYEVKRSHDGSLNKVTPYHYHTKREYVIIGITGEMRILVENEVHTVKPHDLLLIKPGEKHMEIDVGSRNFKVLMLGYDPPSEKRILVPVKEIPADIRSIVEAQPLRTPIPRRG